ncbi:helix-turn-helix transcriptional regulator [Corynebacterium sp. UMB10321]|nr:helix-turn-helix transcriptional regulator [Corynebacterium sp. UMB10321]MDK8245019.1 helix-turn-helix transcriptional regulator [Corynebacterium sp. UMB10321]
MKIENELYAFILTLQKTNGSCHPQTIWNKRAICFWIFLVNAMLTKLRETGTIVPKLPLAHHYSAQYTSKRHDRAETPKGRTPQNRDTKGPMSPTPRSLGEQAREQRRAMRLTQADVADLSMVSERFIREFEQGKRSVRLDKVEAVLAVLGLDVVAVQHVPEALR